MLENMKLACSLLLIKKGINQNKASLANGYRHTRTLQKALIRRFGKSFSDLKNIILTSKEKDEIVDKLCDELWQN